MMKINQRIININKRNANLGNLLINKSHNSFEARLFKDMNNVINNNKKKYNLNNDNGISKNSELKNTSKHKIPRNLRIKANFSKNNTRYDLNQSPIGFIKEIKAFNINNDGLNSNKNNNEGQDLGIKLTSSTIETISNSYHIKKVINSLNKKIIEY